MDMMNTIDLGASFHSTKHRSRCLGYIEPPIQKLLPFLLVCFMYLKWYGCWVWVQLLGGQGASARAILVLRECI